MYIHNRKTKKEFNGFKHVLKLNIYSNLFQTSTLFFANANIRVTVYHWNGSLHIHRFSSVKNISLSFMNKRTKLATITEKMKANNKYYH